MSCYNGPMRKSASGFTIVELLIVIVVIAILAAISIVAYTGIQQRARDSQRKSDLAALAKAHAIYRIDNGPMGAGSGCGNAGDGGGWFNRTYSGYTSMHDCLKNAGALSADIQDPINSMLAAGVGLISHAYMQYTCTQSGITNTYIYASLESEPQSTTALDATCSPSHDSNYGMNYYVKISQ